MRFKTLYLVPSRSRPSNVDRLCAAWQELSSKDDGIHTDLMVINDIDDPTLDEYRKVLSRYPWVISAVGTRLRLGATLNEYAVRYALIYDGIGFMGDDHIPRTPNWDATLTDILEASEPAVVYGNDLFQGQNLPTAVLMSSSIVETLGYMVPAGLVHLYIDNAWMLWGQTLGRLIYVPNVVIEHMHPNANKAQFDEQYVEVNSPALDRSDNGRYDRYVQSRFVERDAPLLRKLGHVE